MNWPLSKLSFLVGTWIGTEHRPLISGLASVPVEDRYEFKVSPGDSFISYAYSASCERPGFRGLHSRAFSGYIGIHPTKQEMSAKGHRGACLFTYSFLCDGGIQRVLSVETEDPSVFLFQGALLSNIRGMVTRRKQKIRVQTKITKYGNDNFTLTHIRWRKGVFRPFLECHYRRDFSKKLRFDDKMKKVAAINWVSLYHDLTAGKLCSAAEIVFNEPWRLRTSLSEFRDATNRADRRSDNAAWVRWFSFLDYNEDYGERLSKLSAHLSDWLKINEAKLDDLAKAYPTSEDNPASPTGAPVDEKAKSTATTPPARPAEVGGSDAVPAEHAQLLDKVKKIDWPKLRDDIAAGTLKPEVAAAYKKPTTFGAFTSPAFDRTKKPTAAEWQPVFSGGSADLTPHQKLENTKRALQHFGIDPANLDIVAAAYPV